MKKLKILAIHHDCLSLMGPTRLFLMLCDTFMELGHDVQIVARTKRITRWKTDRGIITERLTSKQYHLRELAKYHPLKHVNYRDIIQAELPLTFPYNYMPSALVDAIPKADLVFSDSEIYLPLSKFIPGNYIFYVHWPPQPFRDHKPLMPAAPATIWANSHYTAQEVTRLWGPEWSSEWPPLNPQVIYPPLWTEMYGNDRGFAERPYDVVLFSRLYEDKIRFLEDLRGYNLAVIGSDYGLKVPSWVQLWKGVPLKTVIQVLGQSKVYVHVKGFGTLKSGAVSEKEHFGITATEAQAVGCPIIVPRGGGIWEEIAGEGKYGLGFSSVEELKGQVERLTSDEEYWNEWHNKSWESVKRFDIKVVAERVKYLLDGADNSSGGLI